MCSKKEVIEALKSINYQVSTNKEELILDYRKTLTGYRLTNTHLESHDMNMKNSLKWELEQLDLMKVGKGSICLILKGAESNFLSFYNHEDFV